MQQKVYALLSLILLPFASAASISVPAPPSVSATGYLLIDMDSDAVLAQKDAEQRLEPASLTKIMTAYAVFREINDGSVKLSDEVLVSEKAWKTPGSRMFIEVNKRVSVEELLKGMIIQSGNDASVALAEHVAGSEEAFANLMNEHARRLGMKNTHFVNATGLPDPERGKRVVPGQGGAGIPRDIIETEVLVYESRRENHRDNRQSHEAGE